MRLWRFIGMASSRRGTLNVAEWLWMRDHCRVPLKLGTEPCLFADSCIWWDEL